MPAIIIYSVEKVKVSFVTGGCLLTIMCFHELLLLFYVQSWNSYASAPDVNPDLLKTYPKTNLIRYEFKRQNSL